MHSIIVNWTVPSGSVRLGQSVDRLMQASLSGPGSKDQFDIDMSDIKLTRTDTTHDLSQKAENFKYFN